MSIVCQHWVRQHVSPGLCTVIKDVQKRMTRNTDAAERWNSMLCDAWIERG